MLFETYNSLIHIDIKTCKISNESDWKTQIPVGENQNSYKFCNLPPYYKSLKKYCFTYVLSVVYNDDFKKIASITLISIPNGELKEHYGDSYIKKGKIKDKSIRFSYRECKFELLEGENKIPRYKQIYSS